MTRILLTILASILACSALYAKDGAPESLTAMYQTKGVAESFKVGGEWFPFPAYSDRQAWDRLLNDEMKRRFVNKAEKYLKYKWQHIPASTFVSLNITGDKQAMRTIELKNREAIIYLMMGELAEGEGRFLMDIADGLWFYGTSYHWSHSNQTYGQLPRYEMEKIGLGNVRLGATIPIVWYFFHEEIDKIDPSISESVQDAVKRIIIDPALQGYGTDEFKWMGSIGDRLNNWNPWCNHGCLLAILLMEKDQKRLDAAVRASIESVDKYLAAYPQDGACDEGATYWGQSIGRFCEYLQLLSDASRGAFKIGSNPHFQAMAAYKSRVYAGINSETGKSMWANFADGNATGGENPMMLYTVGNLFDSRELKNMAIYMSFKAPYKSVPYPSLFSDEGYRQLEIVRHYKEFCREADKYNQRLKEGADPEVLMEELRASVPDASWYPVSQQAFLRTRDSWFVGAKAGNNGETHGHNDVGSFVLYVDKIPFLVDPGVGTYVKDTFGENRYKIWTMISEWHNCPSPNGVAQKDGSQYAASYSSFEVIKKNYVMKSEFAAAYPEEASLVSYTRTLSLKDSGMGSSLTVLDEYELNGRVAGDEVHFITPGKVKSVAEGMLAIELGGKVLKMKYPETMTPEIETMKIEDKQLVRHWGESLYAIRLRSSSQAPLKGSYSFVFSL